MYNEELRYHNVAETILTRRYNHYEKKHPEMEEVFYTMAREETGVGRDLRRGRVATRSVSAQNGRCPMREASEISRNIHLSYEEIPSEKFLQRFDETAWPETPSSGYEDGVHLKTEFTEKFFGCSSCSEVILRAVIVKMIGRGKTAPWMGRFRSARNFRIRTLLVGYVFLMRLTKAAFFDFPVDVPEIFLVCCIAASKTQYDSHISNIDFCAEIGIQKINYLEGLVLNKLEYEVRVSEYEIYRAIEEINRLGWAELTRQRPIDRLV